MWHVIYIYIYGYYVYCHTHVSWIDNTCWINVFIILVNRDWALIFFVNRESALIFFVNREQYPLFMTLYPRQKTQCPVVQCLTPRPWPSDLWSSALPLDRDPVICGPVPYPHDDTTTDLG